MLPKQELDPYLKAARDLYYPESVIKKLKQAKTTRECDVIMKEARHASYSYE